MTDGPKPTPTTALDHLKKPQLKSSLWSSQSSDLNIFGNLQADLRRAVIAHNSRRTEDYIVEYWREIPPTRTAGPLAVTKAVIVATGGRCWADVCHL